MGVVCGNCGTRLLEGFKQEKAKKQGGRKANEDADRGIIPRVEFVKIMCPNKAY